MTNRVHTLTFPTQDYVSHQHGDARIDCYLTEPARGVTDRTGLLLLIHGWGNDGSVAYRELSLDFADRFDLVVTRVEYRHSGREARDPVPPYTFDRPYDFSKLQTIDCLRAAKATLDRYPRLDRGRLLLWGGSQGAHLGAQCLVFAPTVWAGAALCCGPYHPYRYEEQIADCYHYDYSTPNVPPCTGMVEHSLGPGGRFSEPEVQIRSPRTNAHLVPDGVPIVLIHGTHDDNADIRHSVELYARLLACGKQARFYAIAHGDHSLAGAEDPEADSRAKATVKYAADVLASARRLGTEVWPAAPTVIPVTGGRYEVRFAEAGATLQYTVA
jgi:predicted esterase